MIQIWRVSTKSALHVILAAEVCFSLKLSYESFSSIKIDRQTAKWEENPFE